ncbi:uncharacterized protein LOC128737706 [Sabethes cyaneus]|uniref:uncharacterized protein LOC128737706 n=1 Tax=Sabethes cyaneus TaxID=53552 RepID=UPI00237DDF8F|nr:uncharacterized protein LOC128737706 [Sabethes cyaneus]
MCTIQNDLESTTGNGVNEKDAIRPLSNTGVKQKRSYRCTTIFVLTVIVLIAVGIGTIHYCEEWLDISPSDSSVRTSSPDASETSTDSSKLEDEISKANEMLEPLLVDPYDLDTTTAAWDIPNKNNESLIYIDIDETEDDVTISTVDVDDDDDDDDEFDGSADGSGSGSEEGSGEY